MTLSKDHILNNLINKDISKLILDDYVVHDHNTIHKKNIINNIIKNNIEKNVIFFDFYVSNEQEKYKLAFKINIMNVDNKIIFGRKLLKENIPKEKIYTKIINKFNKYFNKKKIIYVKEVNFKYKIYQIINDEENYLLDVSADGKIFYTYYFDKKENIHKLNINKINLIGVFFSFS